MKKIAIIGCGFLGNIIADAMKKGLLADYTLAGAMSHQKASAEKLCEGLGGDAGRAACAEAGYGHRDCIGGDGS